MEWLTDWGVWHWLILGFVLLIAEILVPGVFLLWWGLSAIVIAGMTKLIPTLPLSFLAVMYAVIANVRRYCQYFQYYLVALSTW